jgi:hypothetical protein
MTSEADAAGSPRRGRTRISARALRSVASAITAEAMGVSPARVGVELADANGSLEVTASTAISVVSLTATGRKAERADRAGSVLERAGGAQHVIRDRLGELTGSQIGRVNVRLTQPHIEQEERVR